MRNITDLKEWKNRPLVIIHLFSSFIPSMHCCGDCGVEDDNEASTIITLLHIKLYVVGTLHNEYHYEMI